MSPAVDNYQPQKAHKAQKQKGGLSLTLKPPSVALCVFVAFVRLGPVLHSRFSVFL